MKTLSSIIFTFLTFSLYAQTPFDGISIQEVPIDPALAATIQTEAGFASLPRTWRVYVCMNDPYWELQAILGYFDGISYPWNVTCSGCTGANQFYQSPFGGFVGNVLNPAFFGVFPQAEFDSYFTIGDPYESDASGITWVPDPGFDPSINFEAGGAFLEPGTSIGSVLSGFWAPPSNQGTIDGQGRVFIAQLTTDGVFNGVVNLQFRRLNSDFTIFTPVETTTITGVTFTNQPGSFVEDCSFVLGVGCTDPLACNYDSSVANDDGSCLYPGCTNESSCNYSPDAGCDDGSCIGIAGCADDSACNYNPLADCDDGSCIVPDGCTDPLACNFDPNAICDDLSCQFPDGCTNPIACNFNINALCDDGSCILPDGCTDPSACNYDPEALCEDNSCLLPDGCTNPVACNFDPNANCDDQSCILPDGCTDPIACNYDTNAICDDSSCSYPGCTNVQSPNFNPSAGCDDGSCIPVFGTLTFPDTVSVQYGDTIRIPFNIESAQDLYAAYTSVIFSDPVMSFDQAIPSDFFGDNTLESPPVLNVSDLDFGISMVGNQSGLNGNGEYYELVFVMNTDQEWQSPHFGFVEIQFVDAYDSEGNLGVLYYEGFVFVDIELTTELWPGDTDTNGTVNFLDLLPIGVYYNTSGPQRSNQSIAWEAQVAPLWSTNESSLGLNTQTVHSDCNGDGVVNISDQAAIGLNLNQDVPSIWSSPIEQNYLQNGIPISNELTPSTVNLEQNNQVLLSVFVETDNTNQNDLYGIGILVNNLSQLVQLNDIIIDYSSSDLGQLGVDFLEFTNTTSDGLEIALTRTTPMTTNGQIKLFDLVLTIESDIQEGEYEILIDPMAGNDPFGQSVTFIPSTALINVINSAGLSVEILTSNTVCEGAGYGMAQLEISGGTEPYSIDWNGFDSTNLFAGDYSVIVTDSNNQTVQMDYTIQDGLANCGCTYTQAVNYDIQAQVDDGTCEFALNPESCQADFNSDGQVGTSDLLFFLSFYGSICN
ncbi:hypothetical protein [Sanyastnella coralliicola]|uniref:hypothetical protein n=1 Tax=Sanyastnella coralliicola TaxID=3069118 RepID=UPI0027B9AF93|nr:hypothetical protein [Longitalea sp. SCSIO 12813]